MLNVHIISIRYVYLRSKPNISVAIETLIKKNRIRPLVTKKVKNALILIFVFYWDIKVETRFFYYYIFFSTNKKNKRIYDLIAHWSRDDQQVKRQIVRKGGKLGTQPIDRNLSTPKAE